MIAGDDIYAEQLACALDTSDLPGLGEPERRGITDLYHLDDYVLVITTDRADDGGPCLGTVPFKGEVVTRMSTWWLDVTGDLAPNAVERVVDPQALLVRPSEPLPVGFSAHTHLTGRLAHAYAQGERQLGTTSLPDHLTPGAPLDAPVIAPVIRRAGTFDPLPMSRTKALAEAGLAMPRYDALEAMSSLLFARGRDLARRRDAELVDTLYSFGALKDGTLVVDALVHSPHQSRYRLLTPDRRAGRDLVEADAIALWRGEHSGKGELPRELCLDLAHGYTELGTRFIADFEPHAGPVKNRLAMSLSSVGLTA